MRSCWVLRSLLGVWKRCIWWWWRIAKMLRGLLWSKVLLVFGVTTITSCWRYFSESVRRCFSYRVVRWLVATFRLSSANTRWLMRNRLWSIWLFTVRSCSCFLRMWMSWFLNRRAWIRGLLIVNRRWRTLLGCMWRWLARWMRKWVRQFSRWAIVRMNSICIRLFCCFFFARSLTATCKIQLPLVISPKLKDTVLLGTIRLYKNMVLFSNWAKQKIGTLISIIFLWGILRLYLHRNCLFSSRWYWFCCKPKWGSLSRNYLNL